MRDELIAVRQGPTTLGRYRYNAQGLRIEKQGQGGPVRYTYDGDSVLTQSDASGKTVARYDYGPDRLLSLEHVEEGRQYYHFDALGSVVGLSLPDGNLKARYRYDAWGQLRENAGDSANPFGFTGHEQDTETGLTYFKARYYDPDTARFISQDSYLGETDNAPSLHRYLYAYANPTVYTDPSGHSTELLMGFEPRTSLDEAEELGIDLSTEQGYREFMEYKKGQLAGAATATGEALLAPVILARDVEGSAIERLSNGRLAAGSNERLGALVAAGVDFVQHPIDTTINSLAATSEAYAQAIARGQYAKAGNISGRASANTAIAGAGAGSLGRYLVDKAIQKTSQAVVLAESTGQPSTAIAHCFGADCAGAARVRGTVVEMDIAESATVPDNHIGAAWDAPTTTRWNPSSKSENCIACVASYTTDRLGGKAGPFLTADDVERIYASVDPSRGLQLNDAVEIIRKASKSSASPVLRSPFIEGAPEGQYALFFGPRTDRLRHVVHTEVLPENGGFRIFDPQNGQQINLEDLMSLRVKWGGDANSPVVPILIRGGE